MKQLEEEIRILEQNLLISNQGKESAQLQHQSILEQFQKLEEEVRSIREQSAKFALDRYQNQQLNSIDQKNWISQNNYSFDETSSSPFSQNNFASAKSVTTTATVFSQKSSTCMTKPVLYQQSQQQQQQQQQQGTCQPQYQQIIQPQQLQYQFNNNPSQQNQNNQQQQQQPKEVNMVSARDGASIFEQTFSQDDQQQLHSQESRKSQLIKRIEHLDRNDQKSENKSNSAAFEILYQVYQKFGDTSQMDQLDQLPEKVNSLILENKLNGKFIKSMKELIVKCAPSNYFESTEPSLKIVWKFIKRVMEEYTALKSKSKLLEEKLSQQMSNPQNYSSQSPISDGGNKTNVNKSFGSMCNNNNNNNNNDIPHFLKNNNENNTSSNSEQPNLNYQNLNSKGNSSADQNQERTIQAICNELEISLEQQIIPKIYEMKSTINRINECVDFIQSNQNANLNSVEEMKLYILKLFSDPSEQPIQQQQQ